MSVTIAAEFDTMEALAVELAGLVTELADDARLCRSAAVDLGAAMPGASGAPASDAGSGWSTVLDLLAQQTGALATTLRAAVTSYRLADAALSDRVLLARADAGAR